MRALIWLLTLASVMYLAFGLAGVYEVNGDPAMDIVVQALCIMAFSLLIMTYRIDVLAKIPGSRFILLPLLVFTSGAFILLSIFAGYFEEPVKEVKLLIFLMITAMGIALLSLRFLTLQAYRHMRGWTLSGLFVVTCTFIASFIAGAQHFHALIDHQSPELLHAFCLVGALICGIACISSMRVLMERGITATVFGGIFGVCITIAAISAFVGLYWGIAALAFCVVLCWLGVRLFKNFFARSWAFFRAW